MLLDTLALWIIFITNLFAVYSFYNWASVVLTNIGLDLATAVKGSLIFNTAGVAGSILVSWLIARLGSRWLQAILGVIGVGGNAVRRQTGRCDYTGCGSVPVQAIMIALAIAGFCILGVQITMYAVAAHVYPTVCRAAGVGWAVGIGRLGGVLSAIVGGVLMARAGVSAFFVAIAGILGLTVIAILVLRRHITPVLAPSAPSIDTAALVPAAHRIAGKWRSARRWHTMPRRLLERVRQRDQLRFGKRRAAEGHVGRKRHGDRRIRGREGR